MTQISIQDGLTEKGKSAHLQLLEHHRLIHHILSLGVDLQVWLLR